MKKATPPSTNVKPCLFRCLMILVAGVTGIVYVRITVVRELSCVRKAWPFSFAPVTVGENLCDLGQGWAAVGLLPPSVT